MSTSNIVSDYQSAVRILACLDAAAIETKDNSWGDDVVAVLRAQSRLQALDFWMRNPDYLANELLMKYETTKEQQLFTLAEKIIDSREPDLRRLPMVRYLFGAFEPLDNALSILRAVDFVRIDRQGKPGQQIREHIYLLTAHGRKAMSEIAAKAPEIAWYKERAKIVVEVAGGMKGSALKGRQYLQSEYADTELEKVIAPITERVRQKLNEIRERQSR